MPSLDDLRRVAEIEFSDIVRGTLLVDHKLRIFLIRNGFIDINLSQRLPDKFGFHWELMDTSGTIFRYDNFPDKKWSNVSTYPYHFHSGSQDKVDASPFPLNIIDGFRRFMEFVRNELR